MFNSRDGTCLWLHCFGRAADDVAVPVGRIRVFLPGDMPLLWGLGVCTTFSRALILTIIPLILYSVFPTPRFLSRALNARV